MARIKVAKRAGEPGITKLRRNQWPKLQKPMRRILSIRTLRKVDESKGNTMPEGRNLLQRNGVGTPQRSPSRILVKDRMPAPGANLTRVKTPSKTNSGGIRSPFSRGRGTNP
jgi:hypothetical protein